jgi:two-component system, OmpR family, sensor histidine kinase MprB
VRLPGAAALRPRLSAPPLRSRLALLAAVSVALAVAACATACWFLVRGQLIRSLDESLRNNNRVDSSFIVDQVSSGQCSPADQRAPNPFDATVQVVDRRGKSCVIVGSKVEVSPGDIAVARHNRIESVHTAHSLNGSGTDYRVLTSPVQGTDVAVSVARPLTETDRSLRNLALILALVGGAGVLAAA